MPEITRVEAKLAELQKRVVQALIIGIVLTVIAMVLVVAVVFHRVSAYQARSNAAIACYVLPQIERSFITLPTQAYYKQNPDELTDALDQISRSKKQALATWGKCDHA